MPDLSIKRNDVYEMARQLADQHGTSMAEIVAEALREKIEREEKGRSKPASDDLVERWMKITEGFGARVKEPWKSTPHGDLLYDERGLPK